MSSANFPARALAVVRCGDASLHGNWARGGKNVDVAVSYYGDDADRLFPEAVCVHRKKGGKWDGLFDFFRNYPETLASYDYFWFPDDDIDCVGGDIDRLVAAGQEYALELFQPALDTQSYYSHLITLGNSSFRLRYVNLVEIMAPMLSRRLLERVLPMLETTRSGFGLDFIWPRIAAELAGDAVKSSAVIDQIRVRHTRPVGGNLHLMMKKTGGDSAGEELVRAIARSDMPARSQINGIPTPRIRVLAAIDQHGRFVPGWRAAPSIARDLIFRDSNRVQPIGAALALRHALKSLLAQ